MSTDHRYRRYDTAADRLPSAVRYRLDEALTRSVLVFDDDPAVLRAFRRLMPRGWNVRCFVDPRAALPIVVEQEPIAVVAALNFAGGDGVAFLREVAGLRPNVRRVLMGQDVADSDLVRAVNDASVHRFVPKPTTADALLEVLEGALAQRRRELAVTFLVDDIATQNERLSRARQALERREAHLVHTERLAVLGRLTDGLSTGLRPLLGQLREVTATLQAVTDDPEDALLLSMGNDAVDGLWDIIHDISRYTRDGGLVIHREPTDMVALVERAVLFARLDQRLKRRQVTVQTERVPTLDVDQRKLRQVLLNLLRNAAEATQDGARITLHVVAAPQHVVVSVADEGTGMPSGVVDHVFEEFFSTKGQDGLGLGLSLVRAIVEEHGGSITCTSRLGVGTTFIVRLPIDPRID